jgi:PAS domain S-box-containing protein
MGFCFLGLLESENIGDRVHSTILTTDAYLALFVVLINLVLAILILVRTSRTALYLIFFFISVSNILWNFGDAVTYFSGNRFWFYLSLIGSGMLPALMFHFINALVRPERKSTAWVMVAYSFSGFLAFTSPLALLHAGTKQFVDSVSWNILYLVLLGPFIVVGIIILATAYNRTKSGEERSRLGYIFIAMVIGVITGLTDLIQLFKIPVPPLGHLGCLVYSSVLAFGVFKHRKTYDIFAQIQMKLEVLSETAEKALRESEEKYRTILHSLEEGYFEVDLSGNLTFFNDALVKFSGYSKEELMGMNNRQYMTEEAAKKVYQTFNEVYRTGKPATPFDWEIILRDGVRKVLETSVSLIRDSKGQPIGFRGIARDVTELKQAEAALQESGEKYRTILHNIEEGYYEVDLGGNVIFFNDSLCKVIGYSEEELMGMNNRQLMTNEMAKRVYQTFNEVYRTGIPAKEFDWELIRKDGTKRFIEASVSLLRDSKDQPIGFYGIARDITERKQAEEQAKLHQQQLMQASKMVALGTLVSSVAHEINNPNNFITLNAPLLREAWQRVLPILDEYYEKNKEFMIGGMGYTEMRERIPRLLSGITDGSKRIKQIVEDLRDFVRRDASDMNQSVDVNAVLRSAISLLSNMVTKSTSHFSVNYGEKIPSLRGNFHRLEQVIINLIQNACQALPDIRRGLSLSTSFNETTYSIVVKVQDEGIGIPPEVLPHITDPFFTTKSSSGGIGLGLSISSRIVKEHGGTLTFNSEPGKGTTAEIMLPGLQANHNSKGGME